MTNAATPHPSAAPPAVEVSRLTKRYGSFAALLGVTLAVPRGTVLAVLGPNGSGKTTFLRLLATLARPSAGEGRVAGHDLVRDREAVRRAVGLVGHGTRLYDDLTPRENLAFASVMAGTARTRDELDAALARVGLEGHAVTRTRDLSSGMRRRVTLARAMLGRPQVLLLDEPFTGLDQDSLKRLADYLHTFRAEGGSAVLVTHSLRRSLELADRLVILAGGRVAVDEPCGGLTHDALQRLYVAGTELPVP